MEPLAELIGESPAVQAIRDQIRRLAARGQAGRRLPSILITGETGTGKGLAARAIHRAGPRAGGPFVDVNCAAIPETLVEAELFGYERGAFTDARRSKPGLFQTAHRGTIFLDEVGLLPLSMQAKLLKVLEDQAVRRLGSNVSEPVDTAIISATNTDLQSAIRERRFREDLYHRLAVLSLRLPPLRERGDDPVLLAEHFLSKACAEYGLPDKTLAPDARARLLSHPWPGNVRELFNVIERVALLTEDAVVTADMLALSETPSPPPLAERPAAVSFDDAMREHLLATLEQTRWNISRTATLLGISRNTLRARIERLGLRTGARAVAPRRPAARVSESGPSPAPSPSDPAAAPSAIRWEHRRITLLAAGVIMSQEKALSSTSHALELMVDKMRTFGGRIEELRPTGIVAAFGLEPVEDAPARAAHAAMAIQKAAERSRRGGGEPFAVTIAIHVSDVLVAQSGTRAEIDAEAKRAEWAGLEAMLAGVEPDGILVSAVAARVLGRRFHLSPQEAAESEAAYRLEGLHRARFGQEGRSAWFWGRRQELELLKARLTSACAGHRQIVGLVGEAGIGKTRLLYEFSRIVREQKITYIEGHCLSYGTDIPYLPAIEILRHACRLTEADQPKSVTRKLVVSLERLGLDPQYTVPYLLQFLGVKEGTEPIAMVSPDVIRVRTFDILRRICVNASRVRPLVLAVEDVHWMDTASEALAEMVESMEGVPLLVIVTYRRSYRPSWIDKAHVTQIALQPLSAEDGMAVVRGILPSTHLADSVAQRIVDRAEGNPFFLEELARIVQERGDLTHAAPVPDTVQEVLLARIHRLPERERHVLQSAAVIGKTAALNVLRVIVELPDAAVTAALAHLRTGDFLYEASSGPDMEYSFKHALTHEVAYESVQPKRRRELHARIVDAIETIYSDREMKPIEQIAHHAIRGELWGKALTYSRRAGENAAARTAHRQAVAYFEQALKTIQYLPTSRETMEQAIDLRFDLRNSLHPLGDLGRILEPLCEAEELARTLPDQHRLGRVFLFMIQYFRLSGDHDRAIQSGERALAIAEGLGNAHLRLAVNTNLGPAYGALGDYPRAIAILTGTVDALQENVIAEDSLTAGLLPVFARVYLVYCLTERGQFSEGISYGEEALRLAETAEHPYSLAFAHCGLGALHLLKGDLHSAIPVLERGLELCQTLNFPLMFPLFAPPLGAAYALSARVTEAVRLLEDVVQQASSMKRMGEHAMLVTRLGEAYLLADRVDDAAESARQALHLSREQKERGREAYALRLLGDISARAEPLDIEQADISYRQALTLAEELGMRPLLGQCHLGLGGLYGRAGVRGKAQQHLAAAITSFHALDMPFWVERAEAELKSLR